MGMHQIQRAMADHIVESRMCVLQAQPQVPWASEMVLNPGLLRDPADGRLHMLFRATGPWSTPLAAKQPAPYPIFLGYACSKNDGVTWDVDLSRPALAPALANHPTWCKIRWDKSRSYDNPTS